MPLSKLRPTFTLTEDRLQELQAVVPEAFADGKIDWEALQTALGEYLEDPAAEHFGLTWPGKREARRLAALPPQGALLPQPGLGVNEDTTHNLFIEADNLEALKLLLKAYAGRVKLIYIDPPYNTGSDFIYPDDYSEPLESYLRQTGQVDEQGHRLTTNANAGGRFHSTWLTMMYPRLLLARQLLSDNGSIFVSIDDNEVHNLKQLMHEIFGEENFIGQIVRATGTTTGQDGRKFGSSFDYMLVYAKGETFELGGFPLSEDDEARFSEEDEKGKYSVLQLRKTGSADRREDRPSMYYAIQDPDGGDVFPVGPGGYESRWRFGPQTYKANVQANLIVWKRRQANGREVWVPYVKYYLEGRQKRPSPLWTDIDGNKKASIELKELLGERIFDTPKPTQALKIILQIATNPNDNCLVLDFFSGSGSLAQAVLELNREDNGNRQFVMVQLPEITPLDSQARQQGYATIAEIGRERIRRVIRRMQTGQLALSSGSQDLGFCSYRLGRSHFTPWQPQAASQPAQLELQLQTAAGPLQPGWQPADLLPEILLIEGFPLDSRVHPLPAYPENQVVEVSHDFCAHRLTICLDETLSAATLAALLQLHPEDTFICLDSALDDESKLRLADRCNLKVI